MKLSWQAATHQASVYCKRRIWYTFWWVNARKIESIQSIAYHSISKKKRKIIVGHRSILFKSKHYKQLSMLMILLKRNWWMAKCCDLLAIRECVHRIHLDSSDLKTMNGNLDFSPDKSNLSLKTRLLQKLEWTCSSRGIVDRKNASFKYLL